MRGPIRHELQQTVGLAEESQNSTAYLDVWRQFKLCLWIAHVVRLTRPTATQHRVDTTDEIVNVRPLSALLTITVNGERTVFDGVGYMQRDQFFGVLMWTVGIGATYNERR